MDGISNSSAQFVDSTTSSEKKQTDEIATEGLSQVGSIISKEGPLLSKRRICNPQKNLPDAKRQCQGFTLDESSDPLMKDVEGKAKRLGKAAARANRTRKDKDAIIQMYFKNNKIKTDDDKRDQLRYANHYADVYISAFLSIEIELSKAAEILGKNNGAQAASKMLNKTSKGQLISRYYQIKKIKEPTPEDQKNAEIYSISYLASYESHSNKSTESLLDLAKRQGDKNGSQAAKRGVTSRVSSDLEKAFLSQNNILDKSKQSLDAAALYAETYKSYLGSSSVLDAVPVIETLESETDRDALSESIFLDSEQVEDIDFVLDQLEGFDSPKILADQAKLNGAEDGYKFLQYSASFRPLPTSLFIRELCRVPQYIDEIDADNIKSVYCSAFIESFNKLHNDLGLEHTRASIAGEEDGAFAFRSRKKLQSKQFYKNKYKGSRIASQGYADGFYKGYGFVKPSPRSVKYISSSLLRYLTI